MILGEVAQVSKQGVYGKSLYFPLGFAVNLKLLYRKINKQKKGQPAIATGPTNNGLC